MSQYTNLPGVNMNIKDGQLLLSDDNTTNSVLIIAEAKTSQVKVPEEPILVRGEDELKENFGSYFNQGQLNPIAAEWLTAKRAGFRNIYLLALKGEDLKARYVYLQDMLFNIIADMGVQQIVLSGLYADEDIEGLVASDFGADNLGDVDGVEVYFTRRAKTPAKAVVLGEESAAVTFKLKKGVNEVSVTVEEALEPANLVSFLNKKVKQDIQELGLEITFSVELNEGKAVLKTTDKVELSGEEVLTALALTDETEKIEGYGNAAVLLGNFAERQSSEASSILAYIATKPVVSTSLVEIRKHVDRLVKRNNQISRNVQVVAGPQVAVSIPGSLRSQWTTGVTQYAALVNGLLPQIAPTNQMLPEASALRYNLSLRQLDNLTGNKYVTFRVKNNRIIVVDGVTTAPDLYVGQDVVRSDFTRLSTLRSTNHLVSRLRDAMEAFIGQPNEFPIYNAMNTAIKAVIKDSISDGTIQDATYSIRLGETLDSSIIDMTILPQFELRAIDVTVGLSTPTNFSGRTTP